MQLLFYISTSVVSVHVSVVRWPGRRVERLKTDSQFGWLGGIHFLTSVQPSATVTHILPTTYHITAGIFSLGYQWDEIRGGLP